jgi:hypothetical protein
VGGVVFVLIDGWQRREEEAPAPAVPRRPEPPRAAPPPPRRDVSAAPSPLWSGWADREPR